MDKKMISLEIPNDLREAIRRQAFKEDLSISKYIRQALEKLLWEELATIRKENSNELEG